MKPPIEKFIYSKPLLLFLILPLIYTYRISEWCSIGEKSEQVKNYRKAIWALSIITLILLIASPFVLSSKTRNIIFVLILSMILINAILVLLYCRQVNLNIVDITKPGTDILADGCDIDNFTLLIIRMLNTACVVLSFFILAYMGSQVFQKVAGLKNNM